MAGTLFKINVVLGNPIFSKALRNSPSSNNETVVKNMIWFIYEKSIKLKSKPGQTKKEEI